MTWLYNSDLHIVSYFVPLVSELIPSWNLNKNYLMLAWYKQVCACIQKFGICCSYVYTQVYLLFQPEMTILHLKVSFVLCKTDMLIESTAFSIIMRFFFCMMCMKWLHIRFAMPACLYIWFNSRTVGWVLIKFNVDIVPLGATLKSYFLMSHNQ